MQLAQVRAENALAFAACNHQFAVAMPTTTSLHLAWFMTPKSVAHALSYDARLVPSTALGVVAEPVGCVVEDLAHFLVSGGALLAEAAVQMQLLGAFGGMGLRREGEGVMAYAALWASWDVMKL